MMTPSSSSTSSLQRAPLGVGALLSENDRLRRELEELRQQQGAAKVDGPAQQPAQPPQLQRRGYGRSFSIRSWDGERTEARTGALAVPSSDAIVPRELQRASSAASPVEAEEEEEAAAAPSEQMLLPPSWLPQRWDGSCEVQRFLMEAWHQIQAADAAEDSAHSLFGQAFSSHLCRRDRAHLGFSAMMPLFFASLQHGHEGGSEAGGGRGQLPVSRRLPGSSLDAFACCAALLQRLKASARFGDRPPINRPEGIERWDYVRELCAQAGLSLDLARLSFSRRRHQKHHRAQKDQRGQSSPPPTPIADVDAGGQDNEPGRQRDGHAVSQDGLEAALARAGAYLRAVQIDIDRLREEADRSAGKVAQSLRRRAAQAPHLVLQTLAAPAHPLAAAGDASGGKADVLLPVADGDAAEKPAEPTDAAAEPMEPQSKTETPAPASAAATEPGKAEAPLAEALVRSQPLDAPSAEELPVPVGIDNDGVVDELIIPTFGQFLEQQLLPLYVRDIPFHILRELVDHYCGVPIDSDDEAQARKVLGCAERVRKAKGGRATRKPGGVSSPKKLTRTRTDDMDGEGSLPPTPSSQGSTSARLISRVRRLDEDEQPLGQLIQGAERKPTLRVQMVNSVIEKRRTGKPALPDVAKPRSTPAGALGHASSRAALGSDKSKASASMVPPPTPMQRPAKRSHVMQTPRVSHALLVSPATEAAAKKRRFQVSPVQWRHQDRMQAEDAPPAPSPLNRSGTADFSLFDDETPWKKKKSNESGF